jgi:hypothetical protein
MEGDLKRYGPPKVVENILPCYHQPGPSVY